MCHLKKPKNRALNSILLAMYKVMSVYPSVNETIIRNLTLYKATLFFKTKTSLQTNYYSYTS